MSEVTFDKILGDQLRKGRVGDVALESVIALSLAVMAPKEKEACVRLPEFVEAIDLPRIVWLAGGRKKPPRNIDKFRLASILSYAPHSETTNILGRTYRWPEGVKHWQGDKPPFVDASLGIALIFNDEMHAVSAAAIVGEAVRIEQLQGTVRVDASDDVQRAEQRKRSGLHQGILWRETLVQAWNETAKSLELPTVELIGTHYRYPLPHVERQFLEDYDLVAENMGFGLVSNPGYWTRPTWDRETVFQGIH